MFFLWSQCFKGLGFVSRINDSVTEGFRQNNERVDRPTLIDVRALTLVRDVTDKGRLSTVCDTAEMCDLKRTTVQCIFIFKVGVQKLEMYSEWRRNFLKTIETYKNGNISTLYRDVKTRRTAVPRALHLVFLDWHSFINNEDI